MTIIDIITTYLREHGFAGLISDDCHCFLDDLMPCCTWENLHTCLPAYRVACRPLPDRDCSECDWNPGEGDYCLSDRPEVAGGE